jgi:hypothetical protein
VRDHGFANFYFRVTGFKVVNSVSYAALKVLGHDNDIDAQFGGERIVRRLGKPYHCLNSLCCWAGWLRDVHRLQAVLVDGLAAIRF